MFNCILKEGVAEQELHDALSNFKLTRKLGNGAFGQVYYGMDMQVSCDCAIKVIFNFLYNPLKIIIKKSIEIAAIEKLKKEAQFLAQFNHPNIIQFYRVIFYQKIDLFYKDG